MAQELSVHDAKGNIVDKVSLDKKIFNGEVNQTLLHQVVVMYQANKRTGTASTKTRGEVSGGGKKPWKQKGTGRARVGSSRNPLWRHGGVVFGPHTREIYDVIPKKYRANALRSSLNAKLSDKEIIVLDNLKMEKPKTKEITSILKNLKASNKSLLVVDKLEASVVKASRNVANLTLKSQKDINALDVLNHDKLIITKDALENLIKRF